ncbi:MAG: aminotransferase class V-fold PLP-dependent enzyme [Alphaproteobacteria bacterium]|nr:aminotransferase class V-fold PLP-dependent enzyme [Alphaproteobacteria bacterium]
MIPCQRHLFEIPDDVAYLNCAYMSPLSHAVADAGRRAVGRKVTPWTVKPEHFFTESEEARGLFAKLINAAADDIAIVPAVSYGLAVAARNLPVRAGDIILVLAEQFPSNVYTWRELAKATGAEVVTVDRPRDGDWTTAILERLDDRVAVTALPHCHWTDGGIVDLEAVGARCREVQSALVLDITQSIGALPFDVAAIRPDVMVAGGYKWMMGPYSLGFLYIAPEHQDGAPLEQNWISRAGSENFARLIDYQDDYQPGARRFDVGERSNFALMPQAIAALQQLHEWTVPAIAETLAAKTAEIAERARSIGLAPMAASRRAGHFLGIRFPDGVPDGLPERLAENQVFVSLRGDSLRVTPHLYNNEADVDRLFSVLQPMLGR